MNLKVGKTLQKCSEKNAKKETNFPMFPFLEGSSFPAVCAHVGAGVEGGRAVQPHHGLRHPTSVCLISY